MLVDRVSQLSHRIFNTTLNENQVSRDSNPFSKSNFQKNILTEDVFESANKQNVTFGGLNDKIAQSTKRIYSIFAGSINDFGKRISDSLNSVKEFCNGIKNSVVTAWNKVSDMGNFTDGFKQGYEYVKGVLATDVTTLINTRQHNIAKMAKLDPHTEVKPMLIDSIKALEADLAIA